MTLKYNFVYSYLKFAVVRIYHTDYTDVILQHCKPDWLK